jgi:RNA polymerase sigma factor (sigma-70 family)
MSVVFLEAWRHHDKELPGDAVLPWLYGIATNVVRNRWRSQRRHRAALQRMPAAGDEPDFAPTADARADSDSAVVALLGLLAALPRREQDVFVLCAWSGLTYDEAALALDLPVGTVRSRLSRARARLRELALASGHMGDMTPTAQEAEQ